MSNTVSNRVSEMAENLIGSEIIKLAGEINEKIKAGEKIFNLTIGDYNSTIFPIPEELKNLIAQAYMANETNYPPADGILELRNAVSQFLLKYQKINYSPQQILIAGGARPLIYAIFQVLVDPQDTVLFPVPSWNNNHYTHLSHAKQIFVETSPENNFMPTVQELQPYISEARLLALCSPLNPTGTTFSRQALQNICEMVLEENKKRKGVKKPLYLMYDQIYWVLTYNQTQHFDPVSLLPEMAEYTVYVDGLSKSFAATGVRVGWSFGPNYIIDKMKSVLGHVGAWSPKAEQVATAMYLTQYTAIDDYLNDLKQNLSLRLQSLYDAFIQLKNEGLGVDAIAPQAAIYLTVNFPILGKRLPNGNTLETVPQITSYLLNEAKVAIVPFSAFGASQSSTWYRISVGNTQQSDIHQIYMNLQRVLKQLK
jgi:aspartate aminotransferase